MSLASRIGTAIGTATAYVVHYMGKGVTPIGVISVVYSRRHAIQKIATRFASDTTSPDVVENNLMDCLEYID